MEVVEILAELENYSEKLPRQALTEAVAKREEIAPLLLATLEKWQGNQEELLELPDYWLHIYAIFLLAQFREPKAYPAIAKFFSIPGDTIFDITGDVVTESLSRILATLSNGNLEPIKQLIENPQANDFVRSAGIDSLLVLMVQGVISRESVIEYFQKLFEQQLKIVPEPDSEPNFIITELICNSCDIYPQELKPYIDRAFELGIVDSLFISEKNIESSLKLGLDASLARLQESPRYSFIEDTIAELEDWYCFQPSKNKPLGLGEFQIPKPKKTAKTKSKAKKKMQKQARRKNRSKKKKK